jgi:DNA-binding winged helix-turn-helix (wHTH) protein
MNQQEPSGPPGSPSQSRQSEKNRGREIRPGGWIACRWQARVSKNEVRRETSAAEAGYDRSAAAALRVRTNCAESDVALAFGRFKVLLRERQLVADGVPVDLGTRAFNLLIVLLEANGELLTKDELLSRVWPGIAVVEENLKVQISALRKVFGGEEFIRTEFGRGYRFTAEVRSTATSGACRRTVRRGHRPHSRDRFKHISR